MARVVPKSCPVCVKIFGYRFLIFILLIIPLSGDGQSTITTSRVSVSQSVRGGCDLEDGIFSCSQTDTADIITSIQEMSADTITVIDIFYCNVSWLAEEAFDGAVGVEEV